MSRLRQTLVGSGLALLLGASLGGTAQASLARKGKAVPGAGRAGTQVASAQKDMGVEGGEGGMRKPLEVKGQSRNLDMMLVLRNEKDKIKFVNVRTDYREQILKEAN